MAKPRSGETSGLSRAAVDWRYTLYFSLFFVFLYLIALFGQFAET